MLFFNIRPQKVVCAPSHPATAFQKEKVRSSWWVFLTEEWTSSHVHTVLVKTAPLRHSLLACRWLTARYCGFVFCTPFLPSHLQGMLSIHSLRAAPLYWKELIFSPLFCSSLTPFPICSVLRAITIWNGVCWWASLQRQGQNSIPPDPLPRHSSPTPLSGMLQQISTLFLSLCVLLLANPVHSKYLYVGAWHSCFNFFLDLSPPFRPGLFCWCASGNYELPEWLTRVPAKPSPGLFSPWGMFVLATPVRALELGISVHTPHLQAALVTCMNVGADVSNNMYPMYLFETYHFQETQFRHPKPT